MRNCGKATVATPKPPGPLSNHRCPVVWLLCSRSCLKAELANNSQTKATLEQIPLPGLEPGPPAPEAGALSTELQGHGS